ncbi:TonB-dependent receptor [Flavisolibacter ginsenosidimutans]|uniref:TonB-dependent receptor n=1 Tax=Flavisolibacter ginsenosidimutans TaxID=661481 RepID=A0A5B8UH76_9BACT|nr:carboxypeptidase-like regulatory domain-containing protein [Flavisolibacter ginsenosidimutans]QEC55762.1 TonB-dependent receptor [Flavisolibacter ginsenosidimutans]
MKSLRLSFSAALLFACFFSFAQKKFATVSGKIIDENEARLSGVSIEILGQQKGIHSSDSGTFSIKAPINRAFALIFSHSGYKPVQQNFLLNEGEEEKITVRMEAGEGRLEEVIIKDSRERTEVGLIRPNPKSIINLPSPVMGVEGLLKVFVGSNNELTSQYNVRGGSYDENLIYVNDFEIFRPYLVRSGQQEGLSFINPELVKNISFYNGGFAARYGDKMSSVLDIQYNTPKKFGGSAYVSLLEQGLHLEGASKKFTYLIGMRNRSNRNLLSRQETQGSYVPSSADLQALLTYQINKKWSAELLGNLSTTKFALTPQSSQLTSSVFSPFFTANLGVDIYFDGHERDQYSTGMLGLSTTYQASKNLKLKWLASRFENDESENIDIAGAYLFGDRDFDKSSSTFGLIVNPLGAGLYQNFVRDRLNIVDYNFSHKGQWNKAAHVVQWGLGYDKTKTADKLNEWQYEDSAGYSLPYNPSLLQMNDVIKSTVSLDVNKFSGYVQDNIAFKKGKTTYTVQGGLRFNYNDLNNELLISPRAALSWKPDWKKDILFRTAIGAYDQPPFYRELRRYDGSLNTALKAQRSWQGVVGLDYNFIGFDRPLRLTTEAYYKYMTNVVPYDIDNVRIRYFGENNAKAYAAGLEMRLFGELVKDAESWVSLSFMRTRENIAGDFYTKYTIDSLGKITDSSRVEGGWFRRPTDRTITFGMFFQDYLATNKNFKVYINALYGTNLPYNIPGSVRYRNALRIEPYMRVDIGFSALLLDGEKTNRRSHSPFRNVENIWASFEVFNLIDRPNTISYLLIKDFANNTFTLPNRLTPRLINFKIVARW